MKNKKKTNPLEGTGLSDVEVIVTGLNTMSKEVKESAISVSTKEARFLTDTYYQVQKIRLASDNQIRSIVQSLDDQDERIPMAIKWSSMNMKNQEAQLKIILQEYAKSTPVGRWLLDTKGIGPVLAAGCLSNFDISKTQHYAQFLSFCGLNDYNNPWLGKELAGKITNKIYTELRKADSKINAPILSPKTVTWLNKQIKNLDWFGTGAYHMISEQDSSGELSKLYNSLLEIYDGDRDSVEDFIIRKYVNKDAVTEKVVLKVLCNVNRRREVVVNGIKNTANSKKKKAEKPSHSFVKSELISYLSKPPYNKNAKDLIYQIGDSFIKQSNRGSLYGEIYRNRRALEERKNINGDYAERAREALEAKSYSKSTESYKAYIQGKLPDAHIIARSRRYACRIFISHLFEAMYMDYHHKKVPYEIYPIDHMEHTDYIPPEVPFDRYISI